MAEIVVDEHLEIYKKLSEFIVMSLSLILKDLQKEFLKKILPLSVLWAVNTGCHF